MAKKYLLYIHDERFNLEPRKSALVNKLLDAHYDLTHENYIGGPTESHVEKEVAEKCAGHTMRMDCGLAGCKYA